MRASHLKASQLLGLRTFSKAAESFPPSGEELMRARDEREQGRLRTWWVMLQASNLLGGGAGSYNYFRFILEKFLTGSPMRFSPSCPKQLSAQYFNIMLEILMGSPFFPVSISLPSFQLLEIASPINGLHLSACLRSCFQWTPN